ncbi:uncharacterized protein LOC108339292 [Vigna angularis]|uniref:uncharacterized protein LOC108339292 n=1 Tax=Phaseolus angularis TaxID=3914 RepID=UPI000809F720|nr:uncharacterized protein LOC108339292 [Vigna angularis]
MEKIFDAKRCPSETRLTYSEYQLSREAIHWWNKMKLVLEESGEILTLELLKNKFYAECFPDNVKHAKEVEFLQFKHLGRFYTQPTNEEWRCRKFKNELRADIQLALNPLIIKEFSVLVEQAKVVERLRGEIEAEQKFQRQQPQQRIIRCYVCGGPHLKSVCPQVVARNKNVFFAEQKNILLEIVPLVEEKHLNLNNGLSREGLTIGLKRLEGYML